VCDARAQPFDQGAESPASCRIDRRDARRAPAWFPGARRWGRRLRARPAAAPTAACTARLRRYEGAAGSSPATLPPAIAETRPAGPGNVQQHPTFGSRREHEPRAGRFSGRARLRFLTPSAPAVDTTLRESARRAPARCAREIFLRRHLASRSGSASGRSSVGIGLTKRTANPKSEAVPGSWFLAALARWRIPGDQQTPRCRASRNHGSSVTPASVLPNMAECTCL